MDRYKVFQAWENIDTDPHGEWVKYSDVEATERRLIEVEDMAAWYQQQHQQLVAERKALQARVRELEGVINEISPAVWDDARMKYVNVQVSREVYDQIQSLKGTP